MCDLTEKERFYIIRLIHKDLMHEIDSANLLYLQYQTKHKNEIDKVFTILAKLGKDRQEIFDEVEKKFGKLNFDNKIEEIELDIEDEDDTPQDS